MLRGLSNEPSPPDFPASQVRRRLQEGLLPLGFLLLLAIGGGCSDEDTSGAEAKCETFLDRLCDKIVDCGISEGIVAPAERTETHAECLTNIKQEIPCGRAVEIDSSYSSCLDDIESMTCTPFLESEDNFLPANCEGAIKLRE